MSITTYAQLQTAITRWLGGRTDLETYYPDWITLFEAKSARRLHVRLQETSTTLTTSSGSVSLPTDYLATRRLYWAGATNIELEYVHPSMLMSLYPSAPSGTPQSYTIEAGSIKVRPTDDTASIYTLVYYAKTAALSGTLNTLFTNYPDLYLYGALAEAGGFVEDDAMLARWGILRDGIWDEISKVDFRERAQMAVRTLAFTP